MRPEHTPTSARIVIDAGSTFGSAVSIAGDRSIALSRALALRCLAISVHVTQQLNKGLARGHSPNLVPIWFKAEASLFARGVLSCFYQPARLAT